MKGNKKLKNYEQAVTAYPEVTIFDITDDIEFIIMACDGIWDCVDVKKFCEEISRKTKINKVDPKYLIKSLFDIVISKTKDCKNFKIISYLFIYLFFIYFFTLKLYSCNWN